MDEYIRTYIRIDSDEDEKWVAGILVPAIETYFFNAGINVIEQGDNPLFKLATQMLACHWFDNRGVVGDDKYIGFGIKNIITQLKFSYEGSTEL